MCNFISKNTRFDRIKKNKKQKGESVITLYCNVFFSIVHTNDSGVMFASKGKISLKKRRKETFSMACKRNDERSLKCNRFCSSELHSKEG